MTAPYTPDARVCPTCAGSGEIGWLAHPPDPQTAETTWCPDCRGDGVVSDHREEVGVDDIPF